MKKKVATHGLSVQFGTFPPKEDRVFPKGVSQGHVTAFDCSIKAKHVLFICVHILKKNICYEYWGKCAKGKT